MPRRASASSSDAASAASPKDSQAASADRDEGLDGERKSPGLADVVPSLRDMLGPYVLLALSIQRAHGYMIEEYLNGLGFLNIQMSTLYRALRQMEREGLVSSSWESGEAGPARRVYTLTGLGRRFLDRWAGALKAYRGLLDRFFSLYGGTDASKTKIPGPDPQKKKDRKR